jgi:hypothetical protein
MMLGERERDGRADDRGQCGHYRNQKGIEG